MSHAPPNHPHTNRTSLTANLTGAAWRPRARASDTRTHAFQSRTRPANSSLRVYDVCMPLCFTVPVTAAARRDTAHGREYTKSIQRISVEQPWNNQSTPAETPKNSHKSTHRSNHCACMQNEYVAQNPFFAQTATLAKQAPPDPPHATDAAVRRD